MQSNEIGFLRKHHVKPVCWRLSCVPMGKTVIWYYVEFNYLGADAAGHYVGDIYVSSWNRISTRRGEIKVYKSAASALADIKSVDLHAIVHLN